MSILKSTSTLIILRHALITSCVRCGAVFWSNCSRYCTRHTFDLWFNNDRPLSGTALNTQASDRTRPAFVPEVILSDGKPACVSCRDDETFFCFDKGRAGNRRRQRALFIASDWGRGRVLWFLRSVTFTLRVSWRRQGLSVQSYVRLFLAHIANIRYQRSYQRNIRGFKWSLPSSSVSQTTLLFTFQHYSQHGLDITASNQALIWIKCQEEWSWWLFCPRVNA